MSHCKYIVAGIASLLAATVASATELVWTPKNPSFGGNPMYSSHLLGTANATNRFTEAPKATTPLQDFNDALQRTVLNRLTSTVSSGLFDSSGKLVPGVINTADFTITVVALGGNQLRIITTDKRTGQSTQFDVMQ